MRCCRPDLLARMGNLRAETIPAAAVSALKKDITIGKDA